VSSAPGATAEPTTAAPYRAAQVRVVAAALELFSQHGVNGTSLQMIADALGVTKAAVYHQFNSKDEIILAVADVEIARLEAVVDAAEAEECGPQAREVLLARLIDLAVERRHVVSTLHTDPVMVRFMAGHEPFQRLLERLCSVLNGKDADAEAQVSAAMISAAIGGAAAHPLVAKLDDETLRYHLLNLARRIYQLPG
jgi:AcrR family transcriptional regulator